MNELLRPCLKSFVRDNVAQKEDVINSDYTFMVWSKVFLTSQYVQHVL